MKKWIFPIVMIFIELTCAILFLSPNSVDILPSFIHSFFSWIDGLFLSLAKLIKLPVLDEAGATNGIISNIVILLLINIIVFSIYFIVLAIKKRAKNRQNKEEIEKSPLPKSEFDPILFERKMPIIRLAFIWLPLNLWILEFIVLNSKDTQEKLKATSPFIFSLFKGSISFYDRAIIPQYNDDLAYRLIVFVLGMIASTFIYWAICSIFAAMLKKPIAKMKADKALRDHEKRLEQCQKEELIVENLEILEHAKFKHNKSIVETIAKVTPKKELGYNRSKSEYFDAISHGITDLGVVEREIKHIETPRLERKPIKIVYPIENLDVEPTIINQASSEKHLVIENEPAREELVESSQNEKVALSPKLDVFAKKDLKSDNQNFEKTAKTIELVKPVDKEKAKELKLAKPLKPNKLRPSVNVTPVDPVKKSLTENISSESIIDLE